MYLWKATLESRKSKCHKLQCGAILVKDEKIIGSGYNLSSVGDSCIQCAHTDEHCERAIHAEERAIGVALALGHRVEGSTLYCTHKPCVKCASKISSFGIKEVVYIREYNDNRLGSEVYMEGVLLTQGDIKVDSYGG